jgi:carboxymethylenebutenolidase
MTELTNDQRAMLAAWQQHAHAEFVLKDADAALATMTENPYVFLVVSGVARTGRAAVREFYANKFLPKLPADLELTSLSQTFGADRIVEEMVMRFTHTVEMDRLLPGARPTHRSAEFALVGVVQFKSGKIAAEHLYWDRRRCCRSWPCRTIRRRPGSAARHGCCSFEPPPARPAPSGNGHQH